MGKAASFTAADDLNSIPRTQMVDAENQFPMGAFQPPHQLWCLCPHTYTKETLKKSRLVNMLLY